MSLEIETADPTPEIHTDVVGIDVGVRYLATTTDTHNHSTFYSGKRIVAKADHYSRLRKRLQRKGTRLQHSGSSPCQVERDDLSAMSTTLSHHVFSHNIHTHSSA
ncbi:MAG: hypothetical protein NVS9B9_01190 [Ktedonobacteraceae bacterium]